MDYILRFTTPKWLDHPLPAKNAFLIIDNVDDLIVFLKQGENPLESVLILSVDDDWFPMICEAFEEFREILAAQ